MFVDSANVRAVFAADAVKPASEDKAEEQPEQKAQEETVAYKPPLNAPLCVQALNALPRTCQMKNKPKPWCTR